MDLDYAASDVASVINVAAGLRIYGHAEERVTTVDRSRRRRHRRLRSSLHRRGCFSRGLLTPGERRRVKADREA